MYWPAMATRAVSLVVAFSFNVRLIPLHRLIRGMKRRGNGQRIKMGIPTYKPLYIAIMNLVRKSVRTVVLVG